ncbi:hypothetical protein ACHAPT_013441 [Fusarium lateritium]
MAAQITLYSSSISDCSGRLRIALNLKGLEYETVTVSLRHKQNDDPQYLDINPSRTVPTLTIKLSQGSDQQEPVKWTQSIAALEFLDEAFPNTRQLLPPTHRPIDRARVRSLVNIVATDIHPLTTHRVGREIVARFSCPESKLAEASGNGEWDRYWIGRGLAAYEEAVQETAGKYSVGDEITLADVCLVPELWTAERLGVPISKYPTVFKIYGALSLVTQIKGARQDPSLELK